VIFLRFALLFLLFSIAQAQNIAEGCKDSGKPTWSRQLLELTPECETRIPSPDRRKVLLMKSNGEIAVSLAKGSFEAVHYRVQPPAMVSWAPNSEAFFINDGEGSGLSSTLRFFRISNGAVIRDDSLLHMAVALFRKKIGCHSSAADPNVWGFGWSRDAKQVFLLVQATVNESCGEPATFISLVVNVADGSVVEQLTAKQTKQRFRSLLFPGLFSK
jgi:hypothetical protein